MKQNCIPPGIPITPGRRQRTPGNCRPCQRHKRGAPQRSFHFSPPRHARGLEWFDNAVSTSSRPRACRGAQHPQPPEGLSKRHFPSRFPNQPVTHPKFSASRHLPPFAMSPRLMRTDWIYLDLLGFTWIPHSQPLPANRDPFATSPRLARITWICLDLPGFRTPNPLPANRDPSATSPRLARTTWICLDLPGFRTPQPTSRQP